MYENELAKIEKLIEKKSIKKMIMEAAREVGTGLNGKDGRDGKDGFHGLDGYTPIKGIDYFDGLNGRDGKDGKNGIDGKNGRDGLNGKNGTDGRNGTNGKNGKDGGSGKGRPGKDAFLYAQEAGYTGTEQEFTIALKNAAEGTGGEGTGGEDGKSAYEIWLELGNTGTEQNFIDSLKGADGEDGAAGANGTAGEDGYTPIKGVDYFDGAQGEQGQKGDKGDKGDDGDQGIQGVKGDTGDQGIQGIQGIQGNTGTGGVITRYNAKASADVSIAVANTWYTGAGVSLTAGTYLVTAQITVLRSTTTALTFSARISDGTNHYASAGDYRASVTNNVTTLQMSTIITLASTTKINVQATGNQTATIKAALGTNAAGNNATQISAIQLA